MHKTSWGGNQRSVGQPLTSRCGGSAGSGVEAYLGVPLGAAQGDRLEVARKGVRDAGLGEQVGEDGGGVEQLGGP